MSGVSQARHLGSFASCRGSRLRPRLAPRQAAAAVLSLRSARSRWLILAGWTLAWSTIHTDRAAVSWRFFDLGARTLLSRGAGGGLHIYATHPALQFGPIALVAAAGFRLLGDVDRIAAVLSLSGLGLFMLSVIGSTRIRGVCPTPRRLFFGGLVFLPVWTELAVHYAHIDDALALLFTLLAVRCVSRQQGFAAAILLACAVDSKPWAAAFLPVLFVLPRGRQRIGSALTWTAAVAAGWLPFVIADSRTLRVTSFAIPNTATSALRALGVSSTATPSWDRPAQILLGAALAAIAVRSGRWPAAIFTALAVRLLIDPGTYAYYTSGLVLAALLVDLYLTQRQIPVYAFSATAAIYAARVLPVHLALLGTLRAAYCVLAVASTFMLAPLARQPAMRVARTKSTTRSLGRPAPEGRKTDRFSRSPRTDDRRTSFE